jgi:hypothetical protein
VSIVAWTVDYKHDGESDFEPFSGISSFQWIEFWLAFRKGCVYPFNSL